MRKKILLVAVGMCFVVMGFSSCTMAKDAPAKKPAKKPAATAKAKKAPAAPAKRVDITPDKLKEMIAKDKNLIVLDVRDPSEFTTGPAPLEKIVNIPLPELQNRLGELPKNKAIAVVCRSGHRSGIAADMLIQNGFTKVYNLTGGMMGYRALYSK